MNMEEQVIGLQPQQEEEKITFTTGEKVYLCFVFGLAISAIEFFLLLW